VSTTPLGPYGYAYFVFLGAPDRLVVVPIVSVHGQRVHGDAIPREVFRRGEILRTAIVEQARLARAEVAP
jgi:hypothetical protein